MNEHAMDQKSVKEPEASMTSRRRFLLGLVAAGLAYTGPLLLGLDEAEAAPRSRRSRPSRRGRGPSRRNHGRGPSRRKPSRRNHGRGPTRRSYRNGRGPSRRMLRPAPSRPDRPGPGRGPSRPGGRPGPGRPEPRDGRPPHRDPRHT